ncbi:MotA/TolQ/ExbB proton channel family protein [Phaeovibrio sulfidiphilus]
MADPYSPRHAWEQGDMVTRLTFVLLLAMSVTTWSILLLRAWDQYALVRGLRTLAPLDAPAILGQAQDPAPGGHPRLQAATGRLVAEYARYRSADRPDISLRDWLTMAGTRETSALVERLQSGLGLLASIASTAPFVGLFGTVWGVYHALVAIGLSGEASLDSVAGPVGEALIMTALGLAVAVPAVLAYNDLARRNRRIVSALERLMSCAYMELLRTTPPKHGGAVHAPTR